MVRKFVSISAACLVLLVGCGGGSSDEPSGDTNMGSGNTDSGEGANSDNTTVLTGIFVDSAVEGVSYSTTTQSNITNSEGEFNYLAGEQVVFSIGDTEFPSIEAGPQVSPVDMGVGSSNPGDTTTNIARLLQSLDTDGNPDNGISISAEATADTAAINFDVSPEEFENDANVINLVANSGSVNSALISAEAANTHLNETLGIDAATNIDGLWIRNSASTSGTGLVDYSFVDGLNISRYNSSNEGCYTISRNTATPLGDNRYQLNADNGPVFYTAVRVGDTLEITFDGEATLIYPSANEVDRNSLPLCEAQDNSANNFNQSVLVDGSPWYSIRDYGNRQECGSRFSFAMDGTLTGATSEGAGTGTYSLSGSGLLSLETEAFGVENWKFNDLTSQEWSTNLTNNDGDEYLLRVFSGRAPALEFSNSLGTNCETELPD